MFSVEGVAGEVISCDKLRELAHARDKIVMHSIRIQCFFRHTR